MTTRYPPAETVAALAAPMLLEAQAVHFNAREPFTHASGRQAPTYVDCRRLISYPRLRARLMDLMVETVSREAGEHAFDVIAGGETAGIPFAAWVAERMGLPMAYIRKKPKGYGRNARIEGVVPEGARVLLVEDLATDGGSKLSFAEAIRESGAACHHAAVIFAYGIFPEMQERLAQADLRLHALCTWWDVLAQARATGAFDSDTLSAVEAYLRDPEGWTP
jgi:orotate phosphoribosyltransferase